MNIKIIYLLGFIKKELNLKNIDIIFGYTNSEGSKIIGEVGGQLQ